jgi:hypothetical protein
MRFVSSPLFSLLRRLWRLLLSCFSWGREVLRSTSITTVNRDGRFVPLRSRTPRDAVGWVAKPSVQRGDRKRWVSWLSPTYWLRCIVCSGALVLFSAPTMAQEVTIVPGNFWLQTYPAPGGEEHGFKTLAEAIARGQELAMTFPVGLVCPPETVTVTYPVELMADPIGQRHGED